MSDILGISSEFVTPLPRFRWYVTDGGTRLLQQQWNVFRMENGSIALNEDVWRTVPTVTADEAQT